jgi:hypothetical protein
MEYKNKGDNYLFMNCYSWIKTKLRENNLDKKVVYDLYDDCKEETENHYSIDSYKRLVRRAYNELYDDGEQLEFSEESYIELGAAKQKLQDINNVVKKENRENYRLYNILESVYSEYTSLLKSIELPKIKIKDLTNEKNKNDRIGILQLSDLHLNEIIYPEESFGNSYDFNVAAKRLKKYITESIKLIDFYNCSTVYLFVTGDILNSKRRLGEQLAQNSSLVRASLLATILIEQVLLELLQKYKVYFTFCIGNESRLDFNMESTDMLSSENWDYLICNNINLLFDKKFNNFNFIEPTNNLESIVKLENGYNALLVHGHNFKSTATIDKSINQMSTRYLYSGESINGVFYGHYHSACITDFSYRSSSLCGGNSYSSNDLMYNSRASQNVYIINKDLSVTAIKVDLQNVDDIEGYQISEELETYNVHNGLKPTIEIISKNFV